MENVKEGSGGAKSNNENPNSASENGAGSNRQLPRTPFTNLSQVDADLALARTLQEQERAYMLLRMNGEGSSDYGSSEAGSFVQDDEFEDEDEDEDEDENEEDGEDEDEDEDAFAVHADLEDGNNSNTSPNNELDSSAFSCDEAFARALQDAEDRELAARMMALTGGAGLGSFNNPWDGEDTGDDDNSNSQDTWEEVDPDELSYEELIALGEVVGTESRGLSADTIASLPSVTYKAKDTQEGEQCVICRVEYEEEDTLIVLSCKHAYHSECINNWLQINKVCPVCSAEVCSTSGGR